MSLRPKLDRASWRTRSVLAALCLGLMAQYLVWRVGSTLPPFELGAASLFSWGYLVVELTGCAMLAVALLAIARRTDRRTEATNGNGGSPGSPTRRSWTSSYRRTTRT